MAYVCRHREPEGAQHRGEYHRVRPRLAIRPLGLAHGRPRAVATATGPAAPEVPQQRPADVAALKMAERPGKIGTTRIRRHRFQPMITDEGQRLIFAQPHSAHGRFRLKVSTCPTEGPPWPGTPRRLSEATDRPEAADLV